MRWVGAFARFWYGFIVGDDWTIAAAVLAGLVLAGLLRRAGLMAWWLVPLAAIGVLTLSLWRTQRVQR